MVVQVTTVPETLFFLRGQAQFFRENGLDMHVASSPGRDLARFTSEEAVVGHGISMRRAIAPVDDLRALRKLCQLFGELRPSVVHGHTPKGGLLAMLAAAITSVPRRVYHIHGLPFMTKKGWRRLLLRTTERLSCLLATDVLSVSVSMARIAEEEGFVDPGRVNVPHHGSINGVDAEVRFSRSKEAMASAARLRESYGIPPTAPVVGFVGRVARDKGVRELCEAWRSVREIYPQAHLLVVGAEDSTDPVEAAVMDELRNDRRVHLAGAQRDMPGVFAALSVLALPSYREGFNVSLLEAAAMEVPVVASDIAGCRDAVVNGVTGTLVPARDPSGLAARVAAYLSDEGLRLRHGAEARRRVLRDFRPQELWWQYLALYDGALTEL